MAQPLVTIGIIFKNNIRSIERCLEALRPLREAAPCELIMADTGSTDGSREVAERYADILFDFPWINDFAAARNAVMDRASGKWFFTVDSDEYLDPDVSELVRALRDRKHKAEMMLPTVRNYDSYEMDGNFTDFPATRIVLMSTGIRYTGNIHECWRPEVAKNLKALFLQKTILHHDGYVEMGKSEEGKEKVRRNMELLKVKLEKDPKSLMTWLQMIESSIPDPEVVDYVRQAVDLVEEKVTSWKKVGPPIFRYAVIIAYDRNLPEFDSWTQRARELFPDALHIRLDMEYVVSIARYNKKDYDACIELGERALAALADYRANRYDLSSLTPSALRMTTPSREAELRLMVASAYTSKTELDLERAFQLLSGLDFSLLNPRQVELATRTMANIHIKSELDTVPLVTEFWRGITAEKLPEKKRQENRKSFAEALAPAFSPVEREREAAVKGFCRYASTLLLPLENEFEMGRAAAVLSADDPQVMSEKLAAVEDWEQFPIHALGHALQHGAAFPPAGKQMNAEELDALAKRLLRVDEGIIPWLTDPDGLAVDSLQSLCWAHSLVMAAVQTFKWTDAGADTEAGLALARTFAQMEQEFLALCYTPEVLEEDHLFLLPPLHRFGWYCVQAFNALDGRNAVTCVRLLRTGLETCKGMKPMVEFLLNHAPELQTKPEPSAELLALAEQIRTVLAGFAPDDPAVVALKQSEAYQKVTYLIEELEVPVAGGLLQ